MVTRHGLKIPDFYANPEDLQDLGIAISPDQLKAMESDDFFNQFKNQPEALLDAIGRDNFDTGEMGQAGAEI
jgi:hypothetical protein